MRKWMAVGLIMAATIVSARVMIAQDAGKTPEATKIQGSTRYFHLQFVIEELNAEGKTTNSRTYTMTVNTDKDEYASIRSGSRVPIATGSFTSGEKEVNTQYQYIDLGANIDARNAREVGHELSIDITADITTMTAALDPRLHQPVIRQDKWKSVVLIPVGKATTIFTSDSLDSKGSLQMVVTATVVQ